MVWAHCLVNGMVSLGLFKTCRQTAAVCGVSSHHRSLSKGYWRSLHFSRFGLPLWQSTVCVSSLIVFQWIRQQRCSPICQVITGLIRPHLWLFSGAKRYGEKIYFVTVLNIVGELLHLCGTELTQTCLEYCDSIYYYFYFSYYFYILMQHFKTILSITFK